LFATKKSALPIYSLIIVLVILELVIEELANVLDWEFIGTEVSLVGTISELDVVTVLTTEETYSMVVYELIVLDSTSLLVGETTNVAAFVDGLSLDTTEVMMVPRLLVFVDSTTDLEEDSKTTALAELDLTEDKILVVGLAEDKILVLGLTEDKILLIGLNEDSILVLDLTEDKILVLGLTEDSICKDDWRTSVDDVKTTTVELFLVAVNGQ